jgi:DNA-binding transcriptional ArsR family regulator
MGKQVVEVIREQKVGYDANGDSIPLEEVYVKIKVAFREKALRLLKGPKLSCFLAIALHANDESEAWPSIDTIVRQTGYSRPTVCSALGELVELGFIEKRRRKHESTLYSVKGYIWYGSESKPTLLGEVQSKETLLSLSESKATKRLPTKRLPTLPEDNPSSKDKPLGKETSSAPSADRKPNGLLPDTQQSRMMFGRLQASAKAQGRRGPGQFKTLEQKRKFDEAAAKLDGKEFERALTVGLEQGINSVVRMTNWIAKWDGNRQTSPRNDPDKFDRATSLTLERLGHHGDG